MQAAKRVLLIGWDAADWKMIHPLMDRGLMPNVQRLVEGGVMANLATLSPVFSPMLWTSIATGKRPFKHGVLGFTEPTPDGKNVQPVTNLSRTTKAVWNILNQNGKRCHVVGWWPSHPAEPINGVMVSNHYQRAPKSTDRNWPMAPGTVHPPEMAEELAELRFHPMELEPEHVLPFVPEGERIDQTKDRRLDMLMRVIADCTSIQSCATHLLANEPWDFAAVYFDAIDHFGHGFMKYHPPKQEFVSQEDFEIFQNVVSAGYVYHDMMLGRLLELAGEDTNVILMSDHGFHPDHLRPSSIPLEPAGPAAEHRELGILAMYGPNIKRDELIHSATLLDVTPTILTMFGLPPGEDMDGKPLREAFIQPPPTETIPSWDDVPGEDGQHPEDKRMDANQSQEMVDQMVALGYIERPSDNREEAVRNTQRELDYNLAMAYMDAGLHGEAAPLLAKIYQAYPLEFRFGIQLAMCLQALGMTDDLAALIDDLNTRWRRTSQRAKLRLAEIAGEARERRKKRREARQAAKEAAAETGDVAQEAAVKVDGEQTEDEKKEEDRNLFNEAEQRVIRSLQGMARGNPQTLDYLASNVAVANKDYEKALEYLQKVDHREARSLAFQLRLGNAYLELRRADEAESCFQRALELDPENPYAHISMARAHLQRRNSRQALEYATGAVGIKFQLPPAHYFLGLARYLEGDIDGAIESLERAISQNPNFAEAHTRLARIYKSKRTDQVQFKVHRETARHIRDERRRVRKLRVIPELPDLKDAEIDAHLPELPTPPESNLVAPLITAPNKEAAEQLAAANGAPFVTVVSGLPRSGTSMLMQMLTAGGLDALADEAREADESNPRGYFELEKVKRMANDNTWLDEARGKAVKVVAPLVPFLPQSCKYRVVLLERNLDEIVASQKRMLERLGRTGANLNATQLREALTRQWVLAQRVLKAHKVPVLELNYASVLEDPSAAAERVSDFLGIDLDPQAMQEAVRSDLYRERVN